VVVIAIAIARHFVVRGRNNSSRLTAEARRVLSSEAVFCVLKRRPFPISAFRGLLPALLRLRAAVCDGQQAASSEAVFTAQAQLVAAGHLRLAALADPARRFSQPRANELGAGATKHLRLAACGGAVPRSKSQSQPATSRQQCQQPAAGLREGTTALRTENQRKGGAGFICVRASPGPLRFISDLAIRMLFRYRW
jgi:hypothetical protein